MAGAAEPVVSRRQPCPHRPGGARLTQRPRRHLAHRRFQAEASRTERSKPGSCAREATTSRTGRPSRRRPRYSTAASDGGSPQCRSSTRQGQRARSRQIHCQPVQAVVDRERPATIRRLALARQQPLHPAGPPGEHLAALPGAGHEHRFEQLAHHAERECPLYRAAARGQAAHPRLSGQPPRRRHQPGRADAGGPWIRPARPSPPAACATSSARTPSSPSRSSSASPGTAGSYPAV